MDKASQTMIENLYKNTGKTLQDLIAIVNSKNFEKHGQVVKFLKEEHGLTHGFANLVAHKANESVAGSVENKDELIKNQYDGKEHFKPIYNKLISEIQTFGNDIDIAPKKAYVSVRRKKQFATLIPATKTRFEIGINLKGQKAEGILEAEKPKAMCSHKIKLSDIGDIDHQTIGWIKKVYENAR